MNIDLEKNMIALGWNKGSLGYGISKGFTVAGMLQSSLPQDNSEWSDEPDLWQSRNNH